MTETAGSVQFGLTLGPLDGALQPSTEEALREGGRRGRNDEEEEEEEDEEEEEVFRAAV